MVFLYSGMLGVSLAFRISYRLNGPSLSLETAVAKDADASAIEAAIAALDAAICVTMQPGC